MRILGWMLRNYPAAEANYKNAPDLLNDKVVMFQDKYYIPLVIAVHVVILTTVGWAVGDMWGVVLLGGLVRLISAHHVTFFINSLCHMWASVNTWRKHCTGQFYFSDCHLGWGLSSNYHHIFQYDYRNGRNVAVLPTKWLIWSCSKVGLAKNLRRIPSFILKSRIGDAL